MSEHVVLSSLISILLLVVLLFWLLPIYHVDSFRQQMFKLRDELFDDAREGKISFNDKSYVMLRSSMNGFIQFGHRLNIWQVMFLNVIAKNGSNGTVKSFYKQLEETTTRSSPEHKELVKSYYLKMNFCVMNYLINSSLILMVTVVVPLMFYLLVRPHIEKLAKFYRGYMDKINAAALASVR